MDSVFPLLESAFSKAFGILTPMSMKSLWLSDGAGTSKEYLSSGWTIGILSFTIIHQYLRDGIQSTGGHSATVLVIPNTRIGDYDAYADLKSDSISGYTRNSTYHTDSISVTVTTFKQS